MKPFDLEAAKRGEPFIHNLYVSEDGKVTAPEKIGKHVIGKRANGSLVYELECGDITWAPEKVLRMLPTKKTVYVNVYSSRLNTIRNHGNQSATFDTEEGARDNAKHNGIQVIAIAVPIEIEV